MRRFRFFFFWSLNLDDVARRRPELVSELDSLLVEQVSCKAWLANVLLSRRCCEHSRPRRERRKEKWKRFRIVHFVRKKSCSFEKVIVVSWCQVKGHDVAVHERINRARTVKDHRSLARYQRQSPNPVVAPNDLYCNP
jgi:hypothetical protein